MTVLYMLGKILLYILLVLIILFLVVLTIPFKYYFEGKKSESTSIQGSVSWLFGAIKMGFNYSTGNGFYMEINFIGIKKALNINDRNPEIEDKKDKNYKEKPAYSYITYDVIKKALHMVFKLLNYCKPRQFQLEATVGFEDPMYTGLLYGIKNAGLAILDKCNIRLEPTFEEEELKGRFKARGGIQIFYLLLVMMEFVFTNPFRSILIKNMKFKIKRRLKRWRIISISTKA